MINWRRCVDLRYLHRRGHLICRIGSCWRAWAGNQDLHNRASAFFIDRTSHRQTKRILCHEIRFSGIYKSHTVQRGLAKSRRRKKPHAIDHDIWPTNPQHKYGRSLFSLTSEQCLQSNCSLVLQWYRSAQMLRTHKKKRAPKQCQASNADNRPWEPYRGLLRCSVTKAPASLPSLEHCERYDISSPDRRLEFRGFKNRHCISGPKTDILPRAPLGLKPPYIGIIC